MPKARLIRLVVYLVITISLIIFLRVISKTPQTIQKKEKVLEEGIPVDLPKKTENYKPESRLNIDIDSTNTIYLNSQEVTWNELVDSITVQQERKPKLSILLCVNKKAKSENMLKVLDLAKEKKMKVGICNKN